MSTGSGYGKKTTSFCLLFSGLFVFVFPGPFKIPSSGIYYLSAVGLSSDFQYTSVFHGDKIQSNRYQQRRTHVKTTQPYICPTNATLLGHGSNFLHPCNIG